MSQEPPFIAKGEQHQKEFSESMQDAFRETQELIEQVGKLFAEKKNLTKADRQEVINALSRIQDYRAGSPGHLMAGRRATFCPDMFSICTELHEVNYVRKKLG